MEFAIKNNNCQFESYEFTHTGLIQVDGDGCITLMAKLDGHEFAPYKTINQGNQLVELEGVSNITFKLVSNKPFCFTVPGVDHTYYGKHKINQFLYEIQYGKLDYDYAKKYMDTKAPANIGGCSAVRNGNFYGRNLDWLYNKQVDFIVHTPPTRDTYAVLGVAGNVPGMEYDVMDRDNIKVDGYDMYKILPFYLLDGINEHGLFINQNVAPLDSSDPSMMTKVIKCFGEEEHRLNVNMVPRYILDNFKCVDEAVNYIRQHVTLYFPTTLLRMGYNIHFLIGDGSGTYALEFMHGQIFLEKTNALTNFHLHGVWFNPGNKVFTPVDVLNGNLPSVKNRILPHGAGLERWNLIQENYACCGTKEGMRKMMDDLTYSKAYTNGIENAWYTEAVGSHTDQWYKDGCPTDEGDKYIITVDTPPTEMDKCLAKMAEYWNNKSRTNPLVWITTHSCVYDLAKKTLYIKNQEKEVEYTFTL